jgi:8-oxo-dGTP diphosphatase
VTCSACGAVHYDNPAPTVGAAIVEGERALVTLRAREPHAGRYDVPGGFLHPGEDVFEALRREVKEELGVEVESGPADFIQASPHRYGDDGDWVISFGFAARLVAGEPRPADDVAGISWVTKDELESLDFAWEHDRTLVAEALRRARLERRR